MATIYTHKDANVRKTWLLMVLFLVFVIGIGWYISYYYDNPAILVIAVVFSLFMNFLSYWQSDKISLAISGAKPASREQYPELYRVTENLAITAGLPMPRLYVMEDPAPNAFATGRDKEHAAVAVTSGLMQMMDTNELSGVIAHELSHIGNKDILLQTVVVVLVGFIAIVSDFFLRTMFSGGRRSSKGGGGPLMIIGLVLLALSPLIAQLIKLAISRKREFLADADGALLTRYPEGLASALEKISGYGAPMERANNATAHMFISNPFGAKASSGLSKLFMTHPPVGERIAALRGTSRSDLQ